MFTINYYDLMYQKAIYGLLMFVIICVPLWVIYLIARHREKRG